MAWIEWNGKNSRSDWSWNRKAGLQLNIFLAPRLFYASKMYIFDPKTSPIQKFHHYLYLVHHLEPSCQVITGWLRKHEMFSEWKMSLSYRLDQFLDYVCPLPEDFAQVLKYAHPFHLLAAVEINERCSSSSLNWRLMIAHKFLLLKLRETSFVTMDVKTTTKKNILNSKYRQTWV